MIMLVVASQLSKDVMFYSHPFLWANLVRGGDRLGNLAVKKANLVLSITCSLNAKTTGCENLLLLGMPPGSGKILPL